MPRHLPSIPRVEWKIHLPGDLAARVELRLPTNPHGTAPAYGVRSRLVEHLLRDYLAIVEAAAFIQCGRGAPPCDGQIVNGQFVGGCGEPCSFISDNAQFILDSLPPSDWVEAPRTEALRAEDPVRGGREGDDASLDTLSAEVPGAPPVLPPAVSST